MNNPELVAHLLKKGGKILIAGGEMKDLPREYQQHPQIIIWDDNQMGINREVPSNVKVIIYNRWVSHATAKKLSNAAVSLHAIKFPMLRTREIKELMSEVVQTEPQDIPEEQIESEIEKSLSVREDSKEQETTMAKQPTTLKEFIAKHINPNLDYSVRGKVTSEGKRLYDIAKQEKFQTTPLSLRQAIGLFVKELRGIKVTHSKSKLEVVNKAPAVINAVDDFSELDRLISEAIDALRLVQEHMPKVRKETERLRGMRERVLELFSQ